MLNWCKHKQDQKWTQQLWNWHSSGCSLRPNLAVPSKQGQTWMHIPRYDICIWRKLVCTLPKKGSEKVRTGLHQVCKCCEPLFRCLSVLLLWHSAWLRACPAATQSLILVYPWFDIGLNFLIKISLTLVFHTISLTLVCIWFRTEVRHRIGPSDWTYQGLTSDWTWFASGLQPRFNIGLDNRIGLREWRAVLLSFLNRTVPLNPLDMDGIIHIWSYKLQKY